MPSLRTIVAVTCVLAISVTAGPAGQAPLPAPIANLTAMAVPATEGAAEPNLAVDAKGRVFMTWLEPKPGGGHKFQMASLAGGKWSAPTTIIEATNLLANWADFPSLFIAADGTMAAHWLERATGRSAYFVRLRTSSDGGKTWSETITPHKDASNTEHGFVSFFDAPGGGVGLVWLDGREMAGGGHAPTGGGVHSPSMTLRSTIIRKGVAGDEMLVDPKVCDCCQTSAARTTDAVLVAYRDRTDKEIRDTSVVRFANGKWSDPITVHADGWEINGCPVNGPVITASGNAAAVAWFTGVGNSPRTNVSFSSDGGRTFGAPIRVDTTTSLGRIGMVMPSADRVLVTSLERAETGARVVLRDVRRDGRASTPVEIAKTTADRSGGFARMVRSGTRLVLAWTEVRPGAPSRVTSAVAEVR